MRRESRSLHYGASRGSGLLDGREKDYPEHFAAGLKPQAVLDKYCFARFQQRVNSVVDISASVEQKVNVLLENKAQGPAGEAGDRLKKDLMARGQRLPLLGNNDTSANRAYIKEFVLKADSELGGKYGLQFTEQFHYIGAEQPAVEEYVKQKAVPL